MVKPILGILVILDWWVGYTQILFFRIRGFGFCDGVEDSFDVELNEKSLFQSRPTSH